MTLHELIAISFDDLRLRKLRSFLTISGVVIAVAAFVAMLSFGAGNQKYFTDLFQRLGLGSTLLVYPPDVGVESDADSNLVLNKAAVEMLSDLPGVALAFPYDAFEITISTIDTGLVTNAHTLPSLAFETKMLSQLVAGEFFANDSARQILVTELLMKDLGFQEPDSLIGKKVVISAELSRVDSGLIRVFSDRDRSIRNRLEEIWIDSLAQKEYRVKIIRQELKAAMGRFLNGYMHNRETVSDTFTICGVLDGALQGGRLRLQPVMMPVGSAGKYNPGGLEGDPAQFLMAMQSGSFLSVEGSSFSATYPQVTVITESDELYVQVKDTIQNMGFRTFSFVDRLEELQDFFFYFDLALGMIGMIALVVAALGIINTMVMSIIERTREIGILISLGADQADIRRLFLVQASVIGAAGAIFGIICGWIGTRIVSEIAQVIMVNRGLQRFEFFDFPLWLVIAALIVGITVSLLAGLYPAARAARVNPVDALRSE
jgi:putative ABC transport system permease protein